MGQPTEVTAISLHSLLTRIGLMEEQLAIAPTTVSLPIDSSTWDTIELRVAALESNLFDSDNQPEPSQLSDTALEAEYLAWRRVNGHPVPSLTRRLDILAWTRHFAHSRHLGRPGLSDESLELAFRQWWAASFPTPPNKQAIGIAVQWGRHLLGHGA
jgi:hypothetical protein